jgi:hypothetical protein
MRPEMDTESAMVREAIYASALSALRQEQSERDGVGVLLGGCEMLPGVGGLLSGGVQLGGLFSTEGLTSGDARLTNTGPQVRHTTPSHQTQPNPARHVCHTCATLATPHTTTPLVCFILSLFYFKLV